MKVLVTGATGFFGSEIVARLHSAGHEVIGSSRRGEGAGDFVSLDVTSMESSMRLFKLAGPVEAVVHAAALAHVKLDSQSTKRCHAVNAIGTQNMVEAAVRAGVHRFVLISSVMVYGEFDLPRVVFESDECRPLTPYGQAKLFAERICYSSGAMSVHILRMAPMYSEKWLLNLRKRVRPFTSNRRLHFLLDPLSRRYSFCSRRNGVEAVLWAVEQQMPPGIYNVADQYEYCQQEILEAVEKADGIGWRILIPVAIPAAMLHTIRLGIPFPRLRTRAYAQYWKFCERNVYSTEKLWKCGLKTPPDLLGSGNRFSRTAHGSIA